MSMRFALRGLYHDHGRGLHESLVRLKTQDVTACRSLFERAAQSGLRAVRHSI